MRRWRFSNVCTDVNATSEVVSGPNGALSHALQLAGGRRAAYDSSMSTKDPYIACSDLDFRHVLHTVSLLVAAVAVVKAPHSLCSRDERAANLLAEALGEHHRHLRAADEQNTHQYE